MNFDLWYNLVNVVFISPMFFFLVLGGIFSYFAVIYDIPYWVSGLFATVLVSWLSITLVGEWVLVPILIVASFFLAIQIFRRIRA